MFSCCSMIDANPTGSEPLQNDTEATPEQVNNASIPQMDSTTDGVRWRGDESMPDSHSPNTSSTPGESISIRVKFMENERTLSVNRTIKVGDLKRYLQQLDNQIHLAVLSNISTILVEMHGTILLVFQVRKMQFKLTPLPPWVLQVKHFVHILHTSRTSTLFRGGGGKILVRPCL